jgi:hypothetical protein
MPKISLPFYSEERQVSVRDWVVFKLNAYQILLFVSIAERGFTRPIGAPILPALLDTGNSHCFTLNEEQLEAAKPRGMKLVYFNKKLTIKAYGGGQFPAKLLCADIWLRDYSCDKLPESLARYPSMDEQPGKLSLGQDGIACVSLRKAESTRPEEKQGQGLGAMWRRLLSRSGEQARELMIPPEPREVGTRLHDPNSTRLSHPNLPLLGMRALCLNSVRLEINCTPNGGKLVIEVPESTNDLGLS